MTDRLIPAKADAYLSPWAVVNRLKHEFSYVEADGEEGRRHVLQLIARLKGDTSDQRNEARAERLNRVKNRALLLCFGDVANSDAEVLSTYLIPGMPLVFEYESAAHEKAAHALLHRCAAVIGYEILKDRRVVNTQGHGGIERRRPFDRRSGLKDRRR